MESGRRITSMSNSSDEQTTDKSVVVDTNISILVVDDDTTCLAIVAAILKKFKYQVVTVKHPNDALCTLRVKGGAFDLVVSDVHMPDMNGFELQQVIAQEFDLPVVLMSADEKESVAVKGLENGAAFFILKPVSPDDVRDLWQFAAMKKKSQVVIREKVTDTPPHDNHGDEDHQKTSADKNNPGNNEIVAADAANTAVADAANGVTGSSSVNKHTATNKKESKKKLPRKEGSTDEQKGETSQSGSQKKPKVIWTNALHNRFLEAIRSIGLDRAVPKRILEVMNVPGLTRENVASHLQKYRIFLRRVSDASCKIQYSADYKGLNRSMLRSSIESSSAAGTTPPTLNLNTFSKFAYRNPGIQFRNNSIVSPLQNLEARPPISSTFQPGFGQSRLLFNNETGPSIIKPNMLMSGYPNSISERSYLRHDYQSRSSIQGQYLSNNFSLDDLTISSSSPVYDVGTPSNIVSSMQTSNYVGYSLENLKQYLSQKYDSPNSWQAPINNNNNNNLTGDEGILQIGSSSSTDHNVVVERNGGGGQLLSDVVADCYNVSQTMLPSSYNLPNLFSGDVENGGGTNESALSPMFDLSDFDIFSTSQLQTPLSEGDHHFEPTILADQVNSSIQNQQNVGDFITSSTFYGGTSHWDNTVASFDQAPNQNSGQGLGNSQEFGTSSQLNTTALLPPTQQQFGFNPTSQTNKTTISSTERDDDEFLESLLAPFDEDQTLDEI